MPTAVLGTAPVLPARPGPEMPDTLRTFPARASGGATALIPKWKRKAATGRGGPDLCDPIGYPALTVSRHLAQFLPLHALVRRLWMPFLKIFRAVVLHGLAQIAVFFIIFTLSNLSRSTGDRSDFCSPFVPASWLGHKSNPVPMITGLEFGAGEIRGYVLERGRESARELGPPPI